MSHITRVNVLTVRNSENKVDQKKYKNKRNLTFGLINAGDIIKRQCFV